MLSCTSFFESRQVLKPFLTSGIIRDTNKFMQDKYSVTLLSFNPAPSSIMHIDLNSCFAGIEQQANPLLRGKPVAVAAYTTPSGCIIAPSVEAKKLGIKVGMRVKDGKMLYKDLIILPPDPWKYRNVHIKLRRILSDYTSDLTPKSIDEFVLNVGLCQISMRSLAQDIKKRIREEVGDWLTVSVGIAPNRFLAKLASGFHKPDGLDEIDKDNYLNCYEKLRLTDLPYIKVRNALRLGSMGINSVVDFYRAPLWKLKAAFASIASYYWYLRLRGYEIDDILYGRKSYGNSYALPKPYSEMRDLSPIISKLTEKMSFRLRRAGYMAKGVHLAVSYRNGLFWHKGMTFEKELFESNEIYRKVLRMLYLAPYKYPVRDIFVSVFNLRKIASLQLDFFNDVERKMRLSKGIDRINERWGNFIIAPARMFLGSREMVPDRVAFGGVKELEEFTITDSIGY